MNGAPQGGAGGAATPAESAPSKVFKWLRKETLFVVAVILYGYGLLVSPEKVWQAVISTATSVWGMVPILSAVFLVIGLFNVMVDKKKVAAMLGRDGGIKGLAIASFVGMLLVGPVYAVFPLIKTVREHGARWAVIGAVLTTWAVKIPMIPLEVAMLGWKFSVARITLVLLAAIPFGFAMEWIMTRAEAGGAGSSSDASEAAIDQK